jgi:membrane associated rhomboid family serine protease
MFRMTPLIRNLVIINVVVFIIQNLFPIADYMLSLWPIRSEYFGAYQLFTYMFAHGGLWHIFFNMLAVASCGPMLETYWGDTRFLIFYIVTGIGAGIIYAALNYFLDADGGGRMLGASGAIYGILMAYGMIFPNLEITLLFPPIPIKAKYMVFILGFMTYAMDQSGSVAHSAHFGGALVAFFLITIWRNQGGSRGY